MRIALFFGSFNPVHNGHTGLGKYVVDNKLVDEVWFVVSPRNPLKNQRELIDEHQRFEMLQLAIKDEPFFKATDIEFKMPVPSYTIDTLHILSSEFPEKHFVLMIGSDNALVFEQWKNFKEILSDYEIIVYPRQGFNFDLVKERFRQMKLADTPIYNISSTQIRDALRNTKDVSKWIHPSVFQYIKDNNLYSGVS